MYPAKVYTAVIYNERLRQAENGRLARAQKRDQPEQLAQPKRRRSILGLAARIAPAR